MKYLGIIILFILFSCTRKNEKLQVNIIPQPNKIDVGKGVLELTHQLSIGVNNSKLTKIAHNFITDVKPQFSVQFSNSKQTNIQLNLCDSVTSNESYSLLSTKKGIIVSASSQKGIFYGLQSLKQLLLFAEKSNESYQLPVLQINDTPRFAWRGLMLDESRHFFGMTKVKQLLDMMAMHKLNVFHWHLTDVPGWRIEIQQYPKLSTIGGMGNNMDANAPAQYYTQREIREIVRYASDRFIEVIPEIDMPGHAKAANRAYPEFSGGGSKSHPEFTFNPGYEGTYTYLTNILREVTTLFPSKYIHLGGDEVHFGNESWNTNKHVKRLMKTQGLKNLREVEAYFIHRMADSIKSLNKTVIGWDEIVDFELDQKNSLVMWWRHDKPEILNNALSNNYKLVLCPRIPLYFDFDQDITHQYGRKWKGAFSPLEMIHAFPPDSLTGFSGHLNQVKGIQANIWTERIQTEKRLDYMVYPRLSALAEAAWTNTAEKNFDNFKQRLKPMLDYLKTLKITYYNPFLSTQTPEPEGD